MRSRLLAFFIALALSVSGIFSLGLSAAVAAVPAAVQEAGVSAEFGVIAPAPDLQAEVPAPGEVLLDVPELLNAHNAHAKSGTASSRLRPLSMAVTSPPYLEGPQRPPCAPGLLA